MAGLNPYPGGECTWYAYSRASSWLPVLYGDAKLWLTLAQGKGLQTGSVPRVGAIAVYAPGAEIAPHDNALGTGHVAVVDSVNADGSVTVSDMNNPALGVVATHTGPGTLTGASGYIYPPGSLAAAPNPVTSSGGTTASGAIAAPVDFTLPGTGITLPFPSNPVDTVTKTITDTVGNVLTWLTKASEIALGLGIIGLGVYVLIKSQPGAPVSSAPSLVKGALRSAKVAAL